MSIMRIDNSRYAYTNIFFGRILAPVGGCFVALSVLGNLVFGDLSNPGLLISILLRLLFIGFMILVFIRRGRPIAVLWVEFDENLTVGRLGKTDTYEWDDIRQMQYEGVRNPDRIDVSLARFPSNDDRILVISLKNWTELRIRVSKEHDENLKTFSAKIKHQPS